MGKDEPLLSNCPLETAEPSRNYARVPGYKKKYKKKTRKRREKKRKMNGVEINTRAYVATRLLLRWDYLYAVTLKTKVFGDYNHARLEVSWITSTRGLLLRGYTGLNSDPGNDSFSDKIRDGKHVDRSTHYSTCRSTQVKSASTDL